MKRLGLAGVLGAAGACVLWMSPSAAKAAPAIPKWEAQSQLAGELKPRAAHLEACLAEAAMQSDVVSFAQDGDAPADEEGLENKAKAHVPAAFQQPMLYAQGEPDPGRAVHKSQATFHRCLQRQLSDQRGPPTLLR